LLKLLNQGSNQQSDTNAKSLVYWLGQKAHVQAVVGSNPAVYWIDVSDAKLLHCTMRITKIKVAKWGTPKKYFKKNNLTLDLDRLYLRKKTKAWSIELPF
jgi:hypothetical protein